jgi:ABC-type nitrate/sulfonate/bicarbonate transport system substrate-binding protein
MASKTISAILLVFVAIAGIGGTYLGYSLQPPPSTIQVTATTTMGGECTIPSELTKVTVGAAVPNGATGLIFVANALGFYRQQGLQVDVKLASGTVMVDSLLTGQLDFILLGTTSVFPVYAQGKSIVSLVTYLHGVSAAGIVVREDLYKSGAVKEISDLNGRRVGSQVGPSLAYAITQLYARYFNVSWTQITYPNYLTAVNALHSGQIDALIAGNPSQDLQAITGGPGVELLSPLSLSPDFWSNVLKQNGYPVVEGSTIITNTIMTSTSMIEQHPDIVQKFVNAVTQANIWILAHDENQVLNALYLDPSFQGIDKNGVLLDLQFVKANQLTSGQITKADWTATVYLAMVATPSLEADQSKMLGSYNTLVNTTFWEHATWCFNQSAWEPGA